MYVATWQFVYLTREKGKSSFNSIKPMQAEIPSWLHHPVVEVWTQMQKIALTLYATELEDRKVVVHSEKISERLRLLHPGLSKEEADRQALEAATKGGNYD